MSASDSLLYFSGGITSDTGCSDTNGGGGKHSVGGVTVSANPLFAPTHAQMASYMAADGGPVASDTGASYELEASAGIDRITASVAGQFANAQVGQIAYIKTDTNGVGGDETIEDWVIIQFKTNNTIDINTIGWTDGRADVVVNVGGAFATPQGMVNNAQDATTADQIVHMYYNTEENINGTPFDLNNVITGTVAQNAWVILESYTNTPGDNGRTMWTGDDGNNGAVIDDIANFIWRNPWLYSATNATGTGIFVGATSAINVIIENGLVDGWLNAYYTTETSTNNSLFIGCTGINASGTGFYLRGISDVAYMCTAYDCLLAFSGRTINNKATFIKCLAYDCTSSGIRARDAGNLVLAIDCTIDNCGSGTNPAIQNYGTDACTTIVINSTVSNGTVENLDDNGGSLYAQYTNTYNPGSADSYLAGAGMLAVNPFFDDEHKPTNIEVLKGGYDNTVIGAHPAKIMGAYNAARARYYPGPYRAEL